MVLEWLLAILHVSSFLGLVVFLSSQITLCRRSWWHESIVPRLIRLSYWYWGGVLAVVLSGLARALWGAKGWAFYAGQPVFWLKWMAFVLISMLSLKVQQAYRRWQKAAVDCPEDVDEVRRRMMLQAHLIMLFPLLGLMMAYGLGLR